VSRRPGKPGFWKIPGVRPRSVLSTTENALVGYDQWHPDVSTSATSPSTTSGTQRHWQVTVKGNGKEFWRAYDLVTLHRCPYIREATGSMVPDGGAAFTSVEFVDITPEE
jgi:hypothetical protein